MGLLAYGRKSDEEVKTFSKYALVACDVRLDPDSKESDDKNKGFYDLTGDPDKSPENRIKLYVKSDNWELLTESRCVFGSYELKL